MSYCEAERKEALTPMPVVDLNSSGPLCAVETGKRENITVCENGMRNITGYIRYLVTLKK